MAESPPAAPGDRRTVGDLRFSVVLSDAIERRGLTLSRIRVRLQAAGVGVSNATLSYWRTGQTVPTRARSLHTIVELERILRVPPGTLVDRVPRPVPRTGRRLRPWQKGLATSDIIRQVIADLGVDVPNAFRRLSVHDVSVIDAERLEVTRRTRMVLQATHDGARRWPVVCVDPAAALGGEPITVVAVAGCRVDRLIDIPERDLLVAEMAAPRPMTRGEVICVEHRLVRDIPADPAVPARAGTATVLERVVPERLRELVLMVEFRGTVPAAMEASVRGIEGARVGEGTEPRPVAVHDGVAQWCGIDLPPAAYALRWRW